jgi:hypothetical protein
VGLLANENYDDLSGKKWLWRTIYSVKNLKREKEILTNVSDDAYDDDLTIMMTLKIVSK